MTALGSVAGFCLKKASGCSGLKNMLKNKYFYLGGVLYFFSALINIYLLRVLPYSVVLPLTAITYVWTMIISYFALKEIISVKKVLGVIFIIIGAIFVTV